MITWCLPQVACELISQMWGLTKEIILPQPLFSLCFCLHASKCNDLTKRCGNVMFILTPHHLYCLGKMEMTLKSLKIKVMFYKADLKGFLLWKVVLGDIWTMERNRFQHELSCLSSETNVTPWPPLRSRDFLSFCLCLSDCVVWEWASLMTHYSQHPCLYPSFCKFKWIFLFQIDDLWSSKSHC